MFYSWPSNGSVRAYVSDAADIRWSTPNIAEVLQLLNDRPDVDEIYVVAHSMGNRGVTQALVKLAAATEGKQNKIREIILAAPDVDAMVFKRDIAPVLNRKFRRTTLYASNNDKALQASASDTVNAVERAGQIINGFPAVPPSNALDIIDASTVATDFLGHSYYGDNRSMISDIFYLIREAKPVSQRNLRGVNAPQGIFWRFP